MSDTKALDRLIQSVTIRVPGSLEPVIKLELFNVLDEFFKVTGVWQEDIEIGVSAGKLTYEVEAEDLNGYVIRLAGVYRDDLSTPVHATMQTPGELVLNYDPHETATYTVRAVLTVNDPVRTNGTPEVPEHILRTYQEVIRDGVLAAMLSQPNKPYANPTMAQYHGRRFRSGMAGARINQLTGNLQGGQLWRFPQTFATIRR